MASLAASEPPGAFKECPWLLWVLFFFFVIAGAYLTWEQLLRDPGPPATIDVASQANQNAISPRSWPYIHKPKASVLVDAVFMSSVDVLAAKIDSHTLQRLQELRDLWAEGKQEPVLKWLSETKADKLAWNLLASATRAAILRFEAATKLSSPRNINEAIRLADAAYQIAPEEDESKIRAIILRHQGKHLEALAFLEGKNDIDSLNLRASLLMQLGRNEEAIRILLDLEKEG